MLSINNWWFHLTGAEQVFWAIAVIFTILFTIQFVISLIGLDFDSDVDVDMADGGHLDLHGGYDVDPSFTLFSVRSIIAFFTFFGWVGVIGLSNDLSLALSSVLATVSGLIAMFFVAIILYQLVKLSEVGTVYIDEALGKYAEVYIPVPEKRNGKGRVTVEFENKLMELDAVTDGPILATGTIVYVLKVFENNTLLVSEVKDKNGETNDNN
jgi:membrane protein implicated in regulation of membrane protease activity